MRIVTGCTTPEQFVAVFYRFCDAKTCFIPTADTRPVGSSLAFSLRLADNTPMLRGTCVVKAAWKTSENMFKRPGVQLQIEKLTTESAVIYEQLLSQKTAVVERPAHVASAPSDGIAEEIDNATTNQHVPRDKAIDLILRAGNAPTVRLQPVKLPGAPITDPEHAKPTVKMPPLKLPEEPRVPGSALVLPANPLSDFDDSALDAFLACNVSEDGEAPLDDDLAIPALPAPPVVAKPADKPADDREPVPTLLGMAPISAATKTAPMPALERLPAQITSAPTRDDIRYWLFGAAALFVAALVLASAYVFAG